MHHTPSSSTHPDNNPFAVCSDDRDGSHCGVRGDGDTTNGSFATTRLDYDNDTSHVDAATDVSQLSKISPSLFPSTLSSWMDGDADTACDEESFHDCISVEDGTNAASQDSSTRISTLHNLHDSDGVQLRTHSNREETVDETTSLIPTSRHDEETPLVSNNSTYRRSYRATSPGTIVGNTNNNKDSKEESSPLRDALGTWLSPYAQSARKAGRRLLSFESDEEDNDNTSESCLHRSNGANNATASGLNRDDQSSASSSNGSNVNNLVRFRPERTQQRSYERTSRLLSRAASSPALITQHPHREENDTSSHHNPMSSLEQRGGPIANHDTIVLKDIDSNQNPNEDGSVMHPWTRLILLEELVSVHGKIDCSLKTLPKNILQHEPLY